MVTGFPQSLHNGWAGAPSRLVLLIAFFAKGMLALSYCMNCSHTQVNGAHLLHKNSVVQCKSILLWFNWTCESRILPFDWKQCFLALMENTK